MKNFISKLHLAGIVGLATTIVGILGDPALAGFLPHKVAAAVAIAGAVIQASTRAINKGAVQEIPKEPKAP